MNIEEARNWVMREVMDNIVPPTRGDVTIGTGITASGIWATTGTTVAQPDPRELQAQHDSIVTQAREEGVKAERARIAERLAALQPMEQPYTRRDWALEQKGEKAMYDKILRAIFGPDKKGEA